MSPSGKRCVANSDGSSRPLAISRISRGMLNVSTRPVVIVIEVLTGQGQDVRRLLRDVRGLQKRLLRLERTPAISPRRTWLGGLILDVHAASDETYGSRRVNAELILTHEQRVGRNTVARIMRDLGLRGLPARKRGKSGRPNLGGPRDLVLRDFGREAPDRLRMTYITEHPTREGKLYCCVVLDAFSRKSSAGPSTAHRPRRSSSMP